MIVGSAIDAVRFLALLLSGAETSYWHLLATFILIPVGMGLGVPAMTTAVLAEAEKESSGMASAVLNAVLQAGGATGVALVGGLAGTTSARIVAGLHQSACIAAFLFEKAAAFRRIKPRAISTKH